MLDSSHVSTDDVYQHRMYVMATTTVAMHQMKDIGTHAARVCICLLNSDIQGGHPQLESLEKLGNLEMLREKSVENRRSCGKCVFVCGVLLCVGHKVECSRVSTHVP